MSNTNKMTSQVKAFAVILILVIFSSMMLLGSCSQSDDITVGGQSNQEILEELNSTWVLDDDYQIQKIELSGINMFWLHKKEQLSQKAILQLHGGAYIRNLDYRPNLYSRMAEQYAKLSGAGVLTVDYRVAPDNPYPAALDDALVAYNYLLELGYSSSDIVVVGDSAGGGLTLALTLYLRDNRLPMPCALVTMSAWTKLNYRWKTPAYVGQGDPKNPYISPYYGEFDHFPPMLMQVGTRDITNDTVAVAQKAAKSGVDVTQTTYKSMVHVFQALFPRVDKANDAWQEVQDFLKKVL